MEGTFAVCAEDDEAPIRKTIAASIIGEVEGVARLNAIIERDNPISPGIIKGMGPSLL